jgi:hypothetical protein
MNFLVKAAYCKFGRQCNSKHITSMGDFSTENKAKFTSFVAEHANSELANPATNWADCARRLFYSF